MTNPDAVTQPPTEPAVETSPAFRGIEVNGVRKSYRLGERQGEAVRGLDLAIHRPGLVGVMGPSGSGKSTLLHLLGGLDRPDEGEIHVGGARIDRMDETALTAFRRRGVGIIFQQFNLLASMTALENVLLPGVLDGRDPASLEDRARSLLNDLGVGERVHHRPDALSGGEQQRVAIARALLFEPPVVLADEPTGALDSAASDRLWRLLDELSADRRVLVLMVTHEPAAAAHCRRLFVLRDGRVADEFDTEGMDAAELAHRATRPVGA
jgi:putative ABC transport system ATP-binding protein